MTGGARQQSSVESQLKGATLPFYRAQGSSGHHRGENLLP